MAPSCPVREDFDPLSSDFLADPYEVLAALSVEEQPMFYAPSIDYYVVTRYADVGSVFLDPETYSAAAAQLPLAALLPEAVRILAEGGHRPQPSMVSLDEPEHRRLRRPTSRAFTPRRTAAMEPRIRATVDDLLDAVDGEEPFDLVRTLTFPLPATIVFSFMGIPEANWARLKEWCGSRASLAWGRPGEDEQVEHARNMAAYRGYLRRFVADKAGARADDFCSALLAIHYEDPEALTHEEIASILFSLSFAGHETTNYLIGNLVRRLLEDRSRWEAIVSDRSLIPGAVEETLRYDTSVPAWRRVTKRPVTLGGSSCRRARSCSCGWPPRDATRTSSANRTASTRSARTPATTWRSARASTTARGRASESSRRSSPWRDSPPASRTYGSWKAGTSPSTRTSRSAARLNSGSRPAGANALELDRNAVVALAGVADAVEDVGLGSCCAV